MFCDHTRYPTVYHWIASGDFFDSERNTFDCVKCEGSGRIWDPDDPRDCYEGNKLRNKIKCPVCKGSGIGPIEVYLEFYAESRRKFDEEAALKVAQEKKFKSILNKISLVLTSEEMKLIEVRSAK